LTLGPLQPSYIAQYKTDHSSEYLGGEANVAEDSYCVEEDQHDRSSPDPLLLATQGSFPRLHSPLSQHNEDPMSESLFTPPHEDWELPPSTSRSPTLSSHTPFSRAQSLDPLLLFNSPSPTSSTLGERISQEHHFDETPSHDNKVSTINLSPLSSPRFALRTMTNISTASTPSPLSSIQSSQGRYVSEIRPPPTKPTNRSPPPSPMSPAQSIQAGEPSVMGEYTEVEDESLHLARYSFRKRGANQLKPYTVEKFQYKQALSHNPDAIVKVRSPTRDRPRQQRSQDRDEGQEESQDLYVDDAQDFSPHASPGTLPFNGLELLKDLPSTDEEESEEIRALRREAKARLAEKKAWRNKASKRPKAFPEIEKPVVSPAFPISTVEQRGVTRFVSTFSL
jgi:hypothetical protein